MTIDLQKNVYEARNFLFKNVFIDKKFFSNCYASAFLTQWISGSKSFEFETSGSTGIPKKITLKRKWMEVSALQTIQILGLWDEKLLCAIPTNKIGGAMMLVRALAGGFDIKVIEPVNDPMKEIEVNHNYTFISLVPYQLHNILKDKESVKKLNRFRNVLIGGANLNEDTLIQLQELVPKVYHSYGMTETCSHIALKKLNHNPWPAFVINPYVEIELNENKQLSIKAQQTGNEWIHTSDCVEFLNDTSFNFLGRSDFVINTGGFKIYPENLEYKIAKILSDEIGISALAVSSQAHKLWGEELILIIEGEKTHEDLYILQCLKPKLDKYELPKILKYINAFPRNEAGKLDRKALKLIMLD